MFAMSLGMSVCFILHDYHYSCPSVRVHDRYEREVTGSESTLAQLQKALFLRIN